MPFFKLQFITALLLFAPVLLVPAGTPSFASQSGIYPESIQAGSITIKRLSIRNREFASSVKEPGFRETETVGRAMADSHRPDFVSHENDGPPLPENSAIVIAQSNQSQSAPVAMDYYLDGLDALDLQNYDDAVESFKKAIGLDPRNLEFQYCLGVAYSRLKRYEEALTIFKSLIQKSPESFYKAYFDIAAIYSEQGMYQAALETLNTAEKSDPNNARVSLEKGYTYKSLRDYEKALQSFERAKELDASLTQLSSYMIGITFFEEEAFGRATEMLNKAIELDPETPVAENARRTIPNIETAAWARKPWYLTTYFNWGYDDNVPLDPLEDVGVTPIGLPSGKGDQFQTLFLSGGYKFLNRKDLEIGVGYSLFSVGYKEWTDSNVTAHKPHAFVQYNAHPLFLRFQYEFSYFYAGGKQQGVNPPLYLTFANNSSAKLRMHSFRPSITIMEPYNLSTNINLDYEILDYLDGVTGDASLYGANITQSYRIPGTQFYPRIAYNYLYQHSDDESANYQYGELLVGVSSPIYWGVRGDLALGYMRTRYPDFAENEERKDSTYRVYFNLTRPFGRSLLLAFAYNHVYNNSDFLVNGKDLYTFGKNVYILSLTYTF